MKKVISLLIVFMLMFSSVYASDENGINIYISSFGSDITGDGSIDYPFATLNAAKSYVATIDKTENINVIFKSGKYHFSETVTFTASDSGVENVNVIYKAEDGADVIFTGAVTLNKSLFKKVENAEILRKLPKTSRSEVLMLDLTMQGISVNDSYPALYVNDNQATIARYPNEGFFVASDANGTTSFDMNYENAQNWNLKKASFMGSMENGYVWSLAMITEVLGTTVYLDTPIRKNTYFFVQNLIEELDAPGEYIIDGNILYYYPVEDIKNSDMEIITFSGDSMIKNDGANNICFEGITFEKSNSSAIKGGSKWVNGVSVKNCNFKYILKDALDIRGYNHTISDNYAYGCGSRFIRFEGGNKTGLIPGNISITRNRIVGCGNLSPSVRGMIKGGEDTPEEGWVCIGNKITNNIIQDCYGSTAINVTGNDNMIMYNEVINMGRIIEDGASIYAGKSATKYGTEIAYNYIHDFNPDNDYGAVYSDDGMSGLSVHHNVIKDVSKAMISGVGMNNTFCDNLMINVTSGINMGTRMFWHGEKAPYKENGTLYQEALRVANNPDLKELYNEKYDNKIEESVNRYKENGYPFFAPWNTVVTGNVSIGNADAVFSRPQHYYMTNDSLNVKGEDIVPSLSYTNFLRTTVDELKTYGKKITDSSGKDLNGTADGNPKFSYSDNLFYDADLQNYSLKSEISSLSDVESIDMEKIGILNTSNKEIFDKNDESVKIYDVAFDDEKAVVSWENVENASYYDIIVSKNSDFSSPIVNERYYNVFHTNKFTFDLNGEGTYYVKINAYGLSREDMFEIAGEASFEVSSVYNKNLENALSILKDKIDDAEKGYYTLNNIEEISNGYDTYYLSLSSSSQEEIDSSEEAVYALIDNSDDGMILPEMEIVRAEAVNNSDIVEVDVIGLPKNSFATVMVTNPDIDVNEAASNFKTDKIRYVSSVLADNEGKISVSFDTSKNDIDYTGVYDIYITNSEGNTLKRSYIYGTVEISDIVLKDGNTEIKKDSLKDYAGKNVTLYMSVKNRTSKVLTPEAYLGIYEKDILKNAFLKNTVTIQPESDGVISISFDVPSDYSDKTDIKLFMWDNSKLLKPLTKARYIFE